MKRAAWLVGVAFAAGGCTLVATLTEHASFEQGNVLDGAKDDDASNDGTATAPFGMTLKQDLPWVRTSTGLRIGVRVNRGSSGNGPIALALPSRPGFFTPKSPLTIPENMDATDIVFDVDPLAPQGDATVTVEATLGTAKKTESVGVLVGGPSGALDTTWNTTGVLARAELDSITTLLEQTDGKLVAYGSFAKSASFDNFVVSRFDRGGKLDPDFGGTGRVVVDLGESNGAGTMALVEGGRLFGVGAHSTTRASGVDRGLLFQLVSDGGPDLDFSPDGGRSDPTHLNFGAVTARPGASSIVAGRGSISTVMALTSMWLDGGRDPSFADGGDLVVGGEAGVAGGFAASSSFRRVAVDSSKRVVAAGEAFQSQSSPGVDKVLLVVGRYDANGKPDPLFNGGKEMRDDVSVPLNVRTTGLVVQSDSKIVVCTTALTNEAGQGLIIRYNADGPRDASFGNNGVLTATPLSNVDGFRGIDVQSDGKLVAAQTRGAKAYVARYAINGNPDSSFAGLDGGVGGAASPTQVDATATAVRVARDGRLYLAAAVGNNGGYLVARFWP